MTAIEVAAIHVAINTLLLVWLAFRVVMHRMRTRTSIGTGNDPGLELAVRVHGNAAEYAPIAMIGLVVGALLNLPVWAVHALGGVFTGGRLVHAIGFGAGIIPLRQLGMVLTWTGMLGIAGALVWAALVLA